MSYTGEAKDHFDYCRTTYLKVPQEIVHNVETVEEG